MSGFYQVDIRPEDREKTAFATWNGHLYQYCRAPMGIQSCPIGFQKVVDQLKRELLVRMWAYLDDVVIASQDEEEHLRDIEAFLKVVSKYGMTLKIEKCHFGKSHIKYLGYLISKDGIALDPSVIEKVQKCEVPKTVKQLQGFLGLCTVYRRHIEKHADIAAPLYDLTKKDDIDPKATIKDKWTQDHQEAFEDLKRRLTTAPVLAAPKFDREFIIDTDASSRGISAILVQKDDQGCEHPVAYASRSLSKAEAKYPSVESEALAIVFGTQHFRPYIEGHLTTTVRTDNSALTTLFRRKDLTGRLAKYQMALMAFNLNIVPSD
uniref:RNA-directed DNA polymerase n=1 Tax=Acrobeloides nanus TaxID=290746 RepID=A0A914ELC1_9BILA